MVPAVRKRAMQTWSCLTNRGRVLLFSPVFLSTRQIKAWRGRKANKLLNTSTNSLQVLLAEVKDSHRDLHFFNACMNVKNCVVTWTDDRFVFNDDNLWRKITVMRTGSSQQTLVSSKSAIINNNSTISKRLLTETCSQKSYFECSNLMRT